MAIFFWGAAAIAHCDPEPRQRSWCCWRAWQLRRSALFGSDGRNFV